MSPAASGLLPVSGKPLVIPIDFQPGEGLADALTRATAVNGYDTTHAVLEAAGLDGRYGAGVASRAIGHEDALAATLGNSGGVSALRPLLYVPDPDRKGWHDFFGARIRLAHREVLRRRVSPRAMLTSAYSRAIWSIKVFSFDPSTKEYLLETCPVCGRHFGFTHTLGLAHCEHCTTTDHEGFTRGGVDLREYPQPLVSVDDVTALDFVTGLIDPDPDVRANFRPQLPECFRGFDRGALFEFVVALACALTADPSRKTAFLPRPASRAEYARFTPEVLATAGRAVLDWPAGFHVLADRLRSNAAQRPGHYGIKKELGPLIALRVDPHIEPEFRELARGVLEDDMARTSTGLTMVRRKENLFRDDLLTVERAAKKFGACRKALARIANDPRTNAQRAGTAEKAPLLVSEATFSEALEVRGRLMPAASVGKLLGIPKMALGSLADRGLLTSARNPIGLPAGDYYERQSVDHFVTALKVKLTPDPAPRKALPMIEAAALCGSPMGNPWPNLITAVLDGKISAWARRATPWSHSIVFESLEADGWGASSQPWPTDDGTTLTRADVALLLGTSFPNVYALIGSGLLPEAPTLRDTQEFAREYMLTQEVARRLATRGVVSDCRLSVQMLLSAGIRPAAQLDYKNRLLWRRAGLETFIMSQPARSGELPP
jgi:hypothetical protein